MVLACYCCCFDHSWRCYLFPPCIQFRRSCFGVLFFCQWLFWHRFCRFTSFNNNIQNNRRDNMATPTFTYCQQNIVVRFGFEADKFLQRLVCKNLGETSIYFYYFQDSTLIIFYSHGIFVRSDFFSLSKMSNQYILSK